jgi:hypothetical protein
VDVVGVALHTEAHALGAEEHHSEAAAAPATTKANVVREGEVLPLAAAGRGKARAGLPLLPPRGHPLDAANFHDPRDVFNAHADRHRILALLSPT